MQEPESKKMFYAKINNLDATPPKVQLWTELKNVRAYYNLFKSHADEFEGK